MRPFTYSPATAKAFNSQWQPKYVPVGVFVGATSGIGQGTVEAFARHTKGNAHIIIIGRNEQRANKILASLPKPTAEGAKHEFVACDVSQLSAVKALASSSAIPPKVNLLFMSPGYMSMTSADKEKQLAVHYYSRFAFLRAVMPNLQAAQEKGEAAVAVSVLHGSFGPPVDTEDLGMKKRFSMGRFLSQNPAYNDAMLQEFAARYPLIPFLHQHPGKFVRTSVLSSFQNPIYNTIGRLATFVSYPFQTTVEDCGEFMLYGMLHNAAGYTRVKPNGEPESGGQVAEEVRKKVWEHTIEVVDSTPSN